MMLRYITIAIVLLLSFNLAVAQDEAAIRKVVERLTSGGYVKGEFKQQRQLRGIAKAITSQGRFVVWRKHGFYWETVTPIFQAISFSNGKIYQWQDAKTVAIVQESSFNVQRRASALILAFFTADFDRLQQDFQISWQFTGKQWSASLVPHNMYIKKALEKVTLSGDKYIESVRLEATAGDITRIRLSVTAEGDEPNQLDRNKIDSEIIAACCLKRK